MALVVVAFEEYGKDALELHGDHLEHPGVVSDRVEARGDYLGLASEREVTLARTMKAQVFYEAEKMSLKERPIP